MNLGMGLKGGKLKVIVVFFAMLDARQAFNWAAALESAFIAIVLLLIKTMVAHIAKVSKELIEFL